MCMLKRQRAYLLGSDGERASDSIVAMKKKKRGRVSDAIEKQKNEANRTLLGFRMEERILIRKKE